MLRAHSFLWHYLWLGPNILLLVLGVYLWRRGSRREYPAFVAFAILSAFGQLVVYIADVLPSVSPWTYWRVDWGNLILEGVLKFVLIGEVFGLLFGSYASIAKLGQTIIRVIGIGLVFAAAWAAAYAPKYELVGLVSGATLLEQSIFFIESGLLLFIFLFASYFRLSWPRLLFGISVGLSISACVHLATWALITNLGIPQSKWILLVFLNMATFHVCVLIWFYYLLVPLRVSAKPSVPLPENNLAVWNRELERLLQQ
jgi:hypothetical protein